MRFAVLLLSASAILAQNGATITGKVSDTDGAALAKAAIQAKNVATGAIYKTDSSPTGAYTLPRLPAGTYELLARVPGMLPFEQKNIAVGVEQTVRLDIRLQDFLSLNTAGEDREFFAGMTTRHKTATGPTPRMANGKPDFSGVWLGTLLQDAGKPELTPSAEAIFKERIENKMKDLPSSRCQPNGVTLYGIIFTYRVVQTPTYLVMIAEHDEPHYRQIFLDGRGHPKDVEPTWLGHSIGRWEGDTLVVDTVGFNGKAWIDLEGHPFTGKTHLIERYRRPDLGHLEVEFTIEDPSAYAKPWTIKRTSDLAPKGEEVQEYVYNRYLPQPPNHVTRQSPKREPNVTGVRRRSWFPVAFVLTRGSAHSAPRAGCSQADVGSLLTLIPKASINRRRQASMSGPVSGGPKSPRSLASASRRCAASIRARKRRSNSVSG